MYRPCLPQKFTVLKTVNEFSRKTQIMAYMSYSGSYKRNKQSFMINLIISSFTLQKEKLSLPRRDMHILAPGNTN